MTHFQVLAATGMGWTVRKVAGMMDVFLDIEAKDEGLFTSLKTKLKNTDNLLLYSGVTKTKGLSDDEVRKFNHTTLPHLLHQSNICRNTLLHSLTTRFENNHFQATLN